MPATKYVDELWEKRASDLAVKSASEAVTLASIVEKETSLPEERAKVAAVFINRLKRRMRLQSDPTIIYGLVGGKGKLDRPLTKQDIALKTPYNTYRVDGLPPGPISNPGKAAIEARPPPTGHHRSLFRCRRQRRARLRRNARRAQEERR